MQFVQVEIEVRDGSLILSQADRGFGPMAISIPLHQWESVSKAITEMIKDYSEESE